MMCIETSESLSYHSKIVYCVIHPNVTHGLETVAQAFVIKLHNMNCLY